MSLLGAAQHSTLTVELVDAGKTMFLHTTISSLKESSQRTLTVSAKKEARLLLTVRPPSGGLIRSGGDYEITVNGAARFGKPLTDTELIAGTYSPSLIYDNEKHRGEIPARRNAGVRQRHDRHLENCSTRRRTCIPSRSGTTV